MIRNHVRALNNSVRLFIVCCIATFMVWHNCLYAALHKVGTISNQAAVYHMKIVVNKQSNLHQYFGFDGQLTDAYINWQFLGQGYRAYNPTLHRFMSGDSLSPFGQGGINGYIFSMNNPIMKFDPSGHWSTAQWAGTGASILAGLVGMIGGPAGAVIGGAAGGFAGQLVTQGIQTGYWSPSSETGISAAAGAGIGAAQAIIGGAFALAFSKARQWLSNASQELIVDDGLLVGDALLPTSSSPRALVPRSSGMLTAVSRESDTVLAKPVRIMDTEGRMWPEHTYVYGQAMDEYTRLAERNTRDLAELRWNHECRYFEEPNLPRFQRVRMAPDGVLRKPQVTAVTISQVRVKSNMYLPDDALNRATLQPLGGGPYSEIYVETNPRYYGGARGAISGPTLLNALTSS